MWELDHKEGWGPKNWCFWTVGVEKTLKSPLDSKVIKPVSPKGNQPWIFIGRTDAETECPVLWPPDLKSQLIGKDPDAGKDWGQDEKGVTEDEMVGWHHWLNGHEFKQTLGDGEGQGSLAGCSPWSCRVRPNWATEQQQWLMAVNIFSWVYWPFVYLLWRNIYSSLLPFFKVDCLFWLSRKNSLYILEPYHIHASPISWVVSSLSYIVFWYREVLYLFLGLLCFWCHS